MIVKEDVKGSYQVNQTGICIFLKTTIQLMQHCFLHCYTLCKIVSKDFNVENVLVVPCALLHIFYIFRLNCDCRFPLSIHTKCFMYTYYYIALTYSYQYLQRGSCGQRTVTSLPFWSCSCMKVNVIQRNTSEQSVNHPQAKQIM